MSEFRGSGEYKFKPDDYQERDVAVFGTVIDWKTESMGGIRKFKGLTLERLEWLIKHGHANPQDCQNYAPSIEEIRAFMEQYKDQATITAHGYAVAPTRSDYRISIEGVNITQARYDAIMAFVTLFRQADDFSVDVTPDRYDNSGHCWYD